MVTMPAREPNKFPRSETTHNVLLMPMSTNALYVRADDIPWLLTYLADECGPGGSQGVPMFDDEDDDALDGYEAKECHVAGLDIQWDRKSQTLVATALSGPLKDKVWKLNMENFTEDKWNAVVSSGPFPTGEVAIHEYGVSFKDATPLQKRNAAWDYVEQQCARAMNVNVLTFRRGRTRGATASASVEAPP